MTQVNMINEAPRHEKAGGIVLLVCAATSVLLANLPFGPDYEKIWQIELAGHSLQNWVNDGLMTVFFFLVGLHLKEEFSDGHLSHPRKALLPVVAALGGMIVPPLVHFMFNWGTKHE